MNFIYYIVCEFFSRQLVVKLDCLEAFPLEVEKTQALLMAGGIALKQVDSEMPHGTAILEWVPPRS